MRWAVIYDTSPYEVSSLWLKQVNQEASKPNLTKIGVYILAKPILNFSQSGGREKRLSSWLLILGHVKPSKFDWKGLTYPYLVDTKHCVRGVYWYKNFTFILEKLLTCQKFQGGVLNPLPIMWARVLSIKADHGVNHSAPFATSGTRSGAESGSRRRRTRNSSATFCLSLPSPKSSYFSRRMERRSGHRSFLYRQVDSFRLCHCRSQL